MNKILFASLALSLTLGIACGGGGSNLVSSGKSSSGGSSNSGSSSSSGGSTSGAPSPTAPTPAPTTPAPITPAPAPAPTTQATTTLVAETGNNTSGSSSFAGFSNGDIAPANVSKVDVQNLLYAGTTAKVFAHLMPWFGDGSHKNVGYTSWNAAQVALQVNDMVSRGINGMIIDWYGQNNTNLNTTTQLIFAEAVKHPGFEVAVMVDAGGVSGRSHHLFDLRAQLHSDELRNFLGLHEDGRPLGHSFLRRRESGSQLDHRAGLRSGQPYLCL